MQKMQISPLKIVDRHLKYYLFFLYRLLITFAKSLDPDQARQTIRVSNSFDSDQARQNVGPDLDQNYLIL